MEPLFSRPLINIREYLRLVFEPSDNQRDLEERMDRYVTDVIEKLYGASSVTSDTELNVLSLGQETIVPRVAVHPEQYLSQLVREVVHHCINTSSPNFIGHMTSALPMFFRPLSRLLVALNQNVVKVETSKSFTVHERQTLTFMHHLVYGCSESFYAEHGQNPASTLGIVTSGGTLSNLTALWIARNTALYSQEADIERDGYALALQKNGYRRGVIIGSSLMHYSIDKAADILGLGSDSIIRIDCDSRGRMDLIKLAKEMTACQERKDCILAIIGIAGTTESGAIDPLESIAGLARAKDIHFHVDAAWGGPLLMSDVHKYKLRGIEWADTVTIDGHKQMYLPMGIGLLLMKDPHAAARIEKKAKYIIREGSFDLGRRSLEGSRPAMSMFLHAGLHLLGREGYGYLLDEGVRKTQWMANLLVGHPAFELIGEPEINILTYRYIPTSLREAVRTCTLRPEENDRINRLNICLQEIQSRQGVSFVSRTTLCGIDGLPESVVVLRVILANPLTTEEHIKNILEVQQKIAGELELTFE
ncbi:hypothetical protein B7C51_09035 [Paenibacillus larvae subsp. pulvifaciens]|uniref:Pyridoxal-dependent aspartate 1-decarboxylase n=1 Tax=Paenibacillus larvae subsp. pulvifaciens TaxID=1477 RepID=A0A1V0URN1_9BACL|nr:aminotransferase class V-fold PLP-dependent enzyme [Paenibacillus larvae]ARF67939.1 hypothetical protein B7C51_09035 [Paenibacillus larvae subsp. pulvifaciens]